MLIGDQLSGNNQNSLSNTVNSSATTSITPTSNVPSSQSVHQQIGQNSSNSLVPHSQSAYEVGQVTLAQQAIHQQLQQRFASVNGSNSGKDEINLF